MEKKKTTKRKEEREAQDKRLVHGAYKIISAPPGEILELPAVQEMLQRLQTDVNNHPSLEIFGLASSIKAHYLIAQGLTLHLQRCSFIGEKVPLEFFNLLRSFWDSYRQDMKALQSLKIKAIAKGNKDWDIDPLEEIEKAEKDLLVAEAGPSKDPKRFKKKKSP